MALLKVSRLLLQILDILSQPVLHYLLGRAVSKAAFSDRLEPRRSFCDQATNILLELLLGVDGLHILSCLLHLSQKPLECVHKAVRVCCKL